MQQYVRNNGSLKDHPKRPNYDDLNEYFWNRRWLDHNKNYHDEDAQFFWGKKYNKGFLIDLDPKTGKVKRKHIWHRQKHAARTVFPTDGDDEIDLTFARIVPLCLFCFLSSGDRAKRRQ